MKRVSLLSDMHLRSIKTKLLLMSRNHEATKHLEVSRYRRLLNGIYMQFHVTDWQTALELCCPANRVLENSSPDFVANGAGNVLCVTFFAKTVFFFFFRTDLHFNQVGSSH